MSQILNLAVCAELKIGTKEKEKIAKTQRTISELRQFWNLKDKLIPVIIWIISQRNLQNEQKNKRA